MKNQSKTNEQGFTLIELMIVAVLTFMVLAIAVALGGSVYQGDQAYGERRNLDSRRSVLQETLQFDLETAGKDLVQQPNHTLTGTLDLSFAAHPDFVTGHGSVSRNSQTSGSPLISTLSLTSQTGRFELTVSSLQNSRIEIFSGHDTRDLIFSGNSWSIVENGTTAANSPAESSAVEIGDVFVLQTALSPSSSNRILEYYRIRNDERTLLYQSRQNLNSSTYTFQILQMPVGATISAIHGVGVFVENTPSVRQTALLPMNNGTRLSDVVSISDTNLTIFKGSTETDSLRLTQAVTFTTAQMLLYTEKLRRGSYTAGDYALLADFTNQKSVLLKFVDGDISAGRLTFIPVNENSTLAFGQFYSNTSDYQGFQFSPENSLLVKISPPVFYRVNLNNNLRQIERSEGETNQWNLVEMNVAGFSVTRTLTQDRPTFSVSAEILSEGIETKASTDQSVPSRTLSFAVIPRIFNDSTNNTQ